MNYTGEIPRGGNPWSTIQRSFKQGSPLARLLHVNIGVYLLVALFQAFAWLAGTQNAEQLSLHYLGAPADLARLARVPWTPLTYMFTHLGFLHLLFNMLWLYWFGSIFRERLPGNLVGVYLAGGIAGAGAYILAYNLLPVFAPDLPLSSAIGASGAVMAIVFAVCTYLPNHRVYILLVGPVRLVHLALFTVIVDAISIPGGNAGGHIAHLGGALFGCLFSLAARRGIDLSRLPLLHRRPAKRARRKVNMRVEYKKDAKEMSDKEYNMERRKRDNRVNEILDKISRSGYDSLTKEERETLFKTGRQ
ncbi:MAG: rhomboid family intramembrane serine protease [Odoribacteraceae bacterium]|jgi:membrane associated rhomboid family serine protease|nr:rhomboid family intramembrane serine protease [Odoribacteraceae bacterium]